jgi:hypothetical protein
MVFRQHRYSSTPASQHGRTQLRTGEQLPVDMAGDENLNENRRLPDEKAFACRLPATVAIAEKSELERCRDVVKV